MMLKLSEVTPVQIILHAPHTISTLDGSPLYPEMVICLPCYRSYFQKLGDLIQSGEVHKAGNNYYLTTLPPQQQRVPKLPSLPVHFDITVEQWRAAAMPTTSGICNG